MKNQTNKKRQSKDPLDRDLSKLLVEKDKWRPLSEFFDTELKKKDKTLTIRLSEDLLALIKTSAKKQNIDIQKLVRKILIKELAKAS